jgi:hypothetical protein
MPEAAMKSGCDGGVKRDQNVRPEELSITKGKK